MIDALTASPVQPPEGAAADWTIPQNWSTYTAAEHALWDRLFARQAAMLKGRVVSSFLRGLDVLRLSKPGIPDFAELSERLGALTGWKVVAAPGLVPDEVFFPTPGRPYLHRRAVHPQARADRLSAGAGRLP